MATINDVARAVGVSIATVSRALSDSPWVADRIRLRVLAAATELGYAPSPAAAGLATGRTGAVAILAPSFRDWFHATALDAAERALLAAGFAVLLQRTGTEPGRFRAPTASLLKRVDGLLVVGEHPDAGRTSDPAPPNVPLVLVGGTAAGCSSVGIDDAAAAAHATRHLQRIGHTRIGFIGGGPGTARCGAGRRYRGWLAAMVEAGPDVRRHEAGPCTVDGGRIAMSRLLRGPRPPTAVLAATDEMAVGALQAARRSGLAVPRDISVMGIDDHEFSAALGLSTVGQPVARQACTAADLLVSAIRAPVAQPVRIRLPTSVVVRESTGPARPCRVP